MLDDTPTLNKAGAKLALKESTMPVIAKLSIATQVNTNSWNGSEFFELMPGEGAWVFV